MAETAASEAIKIGVSISSILEAKNFSYPSLASAQDLNNLNPNF